MAQFRATIEGQRGMASRLGSMRSGITTNTNGWRSGVSVDGATRDERDEFDISATGGSHSGESHYIGRVYRDGDGHLTFELYDVLARRMGLKKAVEVQLHEVQL